MKCSICCFSKKSLCLTTHDMIPECNIGISVVSCQIQNLQLLVDKCIFLNIFRALLSALIPGNQYQDIQIPPPPGIASLPLSCFPPCTRSENTTVPSPPGCTHGRGPASPAICAEYVDHPYPSPRTKITRTKIMAPPSLLPPSTPHPIPPPPTLPLPTPLPPTHLPPSLF